MSTFTRVVGFLCMLKVGDLFARMMLVWLGAPGLVAMVVVLAVWTAASIRFAQDRATRSDAAALVACVVVIHLWSDALVNQHLALIGWIAAILALFSGAGERGLLLRVQCSVVYGFGALVKLNADFLPGGVLEQRMAVRPLASALGFDEKLAWALPGVAIAAVATEAWLAVGLWFRRTRMPTMIIGGCFHLAMLALMAVNLFHVMRLTVFGGLMVAMYLAFLPGFAREKVAAPERDTAVARAAIMSRPPA